MTRLVRYFFLCTVLLSARAAQCQNEASKWYFGGYAGLDFMATTPATLSGSAMQAITGCASMADASGNVLFYTDGKDIYTSTHTVMANGSALTSYSDAAQPVFIVPKPGSSSQYYVFTTNSINNAGLYYSLVDMTLASGQGSVVTKNSVVYTGNIGGKITGTKHCDGVNYWVVIRDYNASTYAQNFRSYSVTATGVSSTAVVSSANTFTYSYYDAGGCMKISPNGRKLALGLSALGFSYINGYEYFELWDFNSTTGAVSNSLGLAGNTTNMNNNNSGAGVEFSPDNTKLYGAQWSGYTAHSTLYQWDLCAGSPSAIAASRYTVGAASNNFWFGTMQMAPNGKIYIATANYGQNNSQAISVINNPNALGSSCNYSFQSLSIAPKICYYSLPNFMGSLFVKPPPVSPFTHTVSNSFGCQGVSFTSPVTPNQTVSACATIGYSLQSLEWNFGDPNSGSADTSVVTNPIHAYTSLGTYTAQLILRYSCGGATDTIRQVVNVNQSCISVTSTSITCASLGSATVVSTAGIGPFTFTWVPTNQTSSVATGLSPGTYTILVYDFGNNFTYTAQTIFTSLIPLTGNLNFQPSVACFGAQTATATVTNIAGGSPNQSYLWTSSTNTLTTPTPTLSAGVWSLVVTDNLTGCQIKEVFMITQPPALNLILNANPASACVGASVVLSGSNTGGTPGYTYTWSAGPASDTRTVTQSVAGTYSYILNSTDTLGCFISDTILVSFLPNPVLTVPATSICPLETGTLQVSGATTYLWFNNTTGNTFTASPSSSTIYSVIGSALGCTTAASGQIIVKPLPNPLFGSNSPRCNGQNLNLFGSGGVAFYWTGPQSFTSNTQNPVLSTAAPGASGQYNFTVTAANSCTAASSGTVVVHPTPTLSASGTTVCSSEILFFNASSVPGAQYLWIGPNSFSSTQQNPFINLPAIGASGNYTVKATSPQGCSNTTITSALVVAPPSLTITLSSTSLCARAFNGSPNTITLTSGGANTYTLFTGPPILSSDPTQPSIKITTGPPYQPTGISTATLMGSNGVCTVSTTAGFSIIPNPTVGVNNYTPVICAGETFTYTSNGAQSYVWTGSTPNYTTYSNGGIAVTDPAINSVFSVYGSSLGCNSALVTSTITVNPIPTVSVTPVNSAICKFTQGTLQASGSANSFTWLPAINLNQTTGDEVLASPVSDQSYIVIGSALGCTNYAVANIKVLALPIPTASASKKEYCVGDVISLTGSGGMAYEWYGPGNFMYGGSPVSFVAAHNGYGGEYTVTTTDLNNCRGSSKFVIVLNPLPEGTLMGNKEGCAPFCSDLSFRALNNSSLTSSWMVNGKSVGNEKFKYCFTNAGDYTITGVYTDLVTTCKNTQLYFVRANEKPHADFEWSPEKPVAGIDDVLLLNNSTGKDQTGWSWYMQHDKTFKSKQENTSYFFPGEGTYKIVYVVENKWKCADTVIKLLNIEPDFVIYVPNAFTPNSDSRNESFKPSVRGVKHYYFQVFNRWGQRLFVTENPVEGWDGHYQGQVCKQDSYVWKIVLSTIGGEQKEFKGSVTLLR